LPRGASKFEKNAILRQKSGKVTIFSNFESPSIKVESLFGCEAGQFY